MIEELVKEKRLQKDQEETSKIFDAIHRQAYWKRQENENKRILKNIERELKKDTKKEFKARLIEDTLNFVLFVIAAIPTILLLVVLCY